MASVSLTTVAAGSSATVTLDPTDKLSVDGKGTVTFTTSAGANTSSVIDGATTFNAFGLVTTAVVAAAPNKAISYSVNDNPATATFSQDSSGNVTGLVGPDSGKVFIPNYSEKACSLCVSGNNTGLHLYGNSFPATVNSHLVSFITKSNGGAYIAKNSAVAGHTSAQVLADMQSAGLDSKAQIAVFGEGTNDASQSVSTASHMANVKAMTALALQNGAAPILILPPPGDYANNALIHPYWLAEWIYANSKRIAAVDPFARYVDTDGTWIAGVSTDNVHPNKSSIYQQAGIDMWDYISNRKPPLLLPRTNAGQGLLGNALALTDSNADGLPDGWSALSLTGQTYNALSAYSYPYRGNKASINVTQSTTGYLFKQISSGYSIGDTLRIAGVLGITAASNLDCDVFVRPTGAGVNDIFACSLGDVTTDTYFTTEFVVPTGTTNLQVYIRFRPQVTGAYTGTVTFGCIDLYNITANTY